VKQRGKKTENDAKIITLYLPTSRLMPSQSLSNGYLGYTTLPHNAPAKFLLLTITSYATEISLVSFGQLSQLYTLPDSCLPSAYLLQGRGRVRKSESLDTANTVQSLQNSCVLSTSF